MKTCKECGGSDLKWFSSTRNVGPATDGRLKMNEVQVIFVLGCEECSETIQIISGDEAAEMLNGESLKQMTFLLDTLQELVWNYKKRSTTKNDQL